MFVKVTVYLGKFVKLSAIFRAKKSCVRDLAPKTHLATREGRRRRKVFLRQKNGNQCV